VTQIAFEKDGISVDATLIAEAFRIPPQTVLDRIRAGQITTVSERGVDEDAGRFRLTFVLGSGRLRLLVDAEGNVIERSLVLQKRRTRPTPAAGVSEAFGGSGAESRR
jgi:hypothetical protein